MLPPLGTGIVSMLLAPVTVRRLRPGTVIGAGPALAAVGFAVLGHAGGTSGLAVVVTGLAVVFAGLMPVSSLGVDLVVSTAPAERAGAASAISETTQEFGVALDIAVLGSIATGVYRGTLAGAVPETVPTEIARAVRDTLGGTSGAGDQLPAGLLATAREAFTAGLQTAAGSARSRWRLSPRAAAVVLRPVAT
jgi:DHA2 family multidrug resistance protein-like MFS transporter